MVELGLESGVTLEAEVDAKTLAVARIRRTSHHLTAQLKIAEAAGGLPKGGAFDVAVQINWVSVGKRVVIPSKPQDGQEWPWPPPNSLGKCVANSVMEQVTLNAVAIASRGVESLLSCGGDCDRPIVMKLVAGNVADPGGVASASRFPTHQQVSFAAMSNRHAGSDPTVLLHEIAHLVLSRGVGGKGTEAPFEPSGESAAVNEGLADLLGLTLWNSARRALWHAAPSVLAVGEWALGAGGRDYRGVLSKAPSWTGSTDPYVQGMALCAALLRFRAGLAQASDEDQADLSLWSTVLHSLPLVPFQGTLPQGCCISRALRLIANDGTRPLLESALRDAGLPLSCDHTLKIQN